MKKRKSMKLAVVALIIGLVQFACSDEKDLSPDTARITLAVTTTSSDSKLINARVNNENSLVFTSGKIKFREVVFDGDTQNRSVSITHEQISEIDYATGMITPAVNIDVPAGEYTNVNLGIEIQDENSDPSIVIEGTYINSEGTSIPIRLEFNSGEVFEANASVVSIPAGSNIVGKIKFDALDWFSVVSAEELDNAQLTNGKIIISETSNADIFDQVANRLDVATQAVFE
ncbi:hypothetical protein [Algoriphagus sp. CAU 1675]|uniref:hypothetical protein n=1 Tax=Algoriphagus sp. CAU 1675 TaxID=3032597 RepID=UPI0023DC3303|nr:hypothetical protein [Algoriphagus sp. CAU 1675]MDF2157218.1 hypothetical protein [Algoriphagus sp. CAU 1675]